MPFANYTLQIGNPAADFLIDRGIEPTFSVSFGVTGGIIDGGGFGTFDSSSCELSASMELEGSGLITAQPDGICPSGVSAACTGSATINVEDESTRGDFSLS